MRSRIGSQRVHRPIRQNKRPIIPRLLEGIVSAHLVIVRSFREHSEHCVHVTIDEGEERDHGENNVCDERADDAVEGLRDSIHRVSTTKPAPRGEKWFYGELHQTKRDLEDIISGCEINKPVPGAVDVGFCFAAKAGYL